ncbi:flippase-like domain-containing protein [Methanobrevibacter sp. DSM 116169]|uniref:flippase-like domain-containing protein n=1 Tax=Methanobrevibacter sp. DSM 116169 TaxID=3242727 RepID=UPI0038FC977D
MDNIDDSNQGIFDFIKDNKKVIIISFIAIAALLFGILFLSGLDDVAKALEKTNLYILALTFLIEIVVIFLWAIRWKYILNKMGSFPDFSHILGILITSLFGKNVTPGSIGGEPLRAYLLTVYNDTDIEVTLASTFVSRVFELLPFIILSLISICALPFWSINSYLKLFFIILIVLMVIAFIFIIYIGINKDKAEIIIVKILNLISPLVRIIFKEKFIYDNIKAQLIEYTDNFSESFRLIVDDKNFFIIGASLALIAWLLDLLNSYLAFIAIGIAPPLAPFIVIFTISILISFIPLLPGSLGITEIIMILLFAPIGIASSSVFAASTLERLSSYFFPTLLGIIVAFYYTKRGFKKSL